MQWQRCPDACIYSFFYMHKLVLISHGESTGNLESRFTGWTDVDLTPSGLAQAIVAGRLLKAEAYEFDIAYTSVLKRATRTLWQVLDGLDYAVKAAADHGMRLVMCLSNFWPWSGGLAQYHNWNGLHDDQRAEPGL